MAKPVSTVKLSTSAPRELADAYLEAAKASGKSVSRVVREALEDHLAATRVETSVTMALEEGHPHAATAAYYRLAKIMSDAALQAMTEAAMLDMDMLGSIVDKMTARLTSPQAVKTVSPTVHAGDSTTIAPPSISEADFQAIQETVARTAAAIRAQLEDSGVE